VPPCPFYVWNSHLDHLCKNNIKLGKNRNSLVLCSQKYYSVFSKFVMSVFHILAFFNFTYFFVKMPKMVTFFFLSKVKIKQNKIKLIS
jgi:hypothetical protein